MRNLVSHLFPCVVIAVACSNVCAQIVIRSASPALPPAVEGMIEGKIGSITSFSMMGGMPDDPIDMLRQKQIQQELDLSKDQIAVIEELQKDLERQSSEIFKAQAKFGGNAMEMMASAQKAVRATMTKELEQILAPKQMKRLGQLEVQMKMKNRGVRALVDEKLSKALSINDEQKTQIRDRSAEMSKELQKEIEKLRERYRKELIKELLSDDQLTKLEDLSGTEFEVQPINIRRFGN